MAAAKVVGALKASGWPLRNFYNMATADPKEGESDKRDVKGKFSGGPLQPYHGPVDYIAVQASTLPKIGIAVLWAPPALSIPQLFHMKNWRFCVAHLMRIAPS